MPIVVEVISDVICPWCYVGKRRLEKAIAATDDPQVVQVRWLPFELNPTMPKEGISRRHYRTRKFGSWQRSQQLDASISAVGELEGIPFHFEKMNRTPNTVDAHRVIWLASQHGCQDDVVEALFAACFSDGQDVGNRHSLVEIGAAAGLQRHTVEAMLDSDDGMDSIRGTRAMIERYQVNSVPFFVINNEITLSGAQQPETFLTAFNRVSQPPH